MSDGILDPLDFASLNVCIKCIKGKQTKTKKSGAYMTIYVLELIHIDICESFPMTSWNSQQYFMSFIDNYSRYG